MSRWSSPRLPRILEPFRIRRFRLLWSGLAISLLGDGIYLVAIAWQVYELTNAATAMGAVVSSCAWHRYTGGVSAVNL